ncbi:GNAT family acetyltransferase [Variovorax ginsengisoli]|uniref:Ribosomal protein S18 acetylase RimI-like enzyme n=1 Tax=Variovorax ginsengisoli TaxID=363844 RepID=A0ABT9SE62_9BURK|nr:GNAT family acetyltransferase [Variovorax ginsengisoli]MDP9902655.1 ribosomal protein S18 acetylase RimI-like enzyme [Variovorax ginsengisoli]
MTMRGALVVRSFDAADTEAVIALWRTCGLVRPWNDPHKDIARKRGEQPELFLVACVDERIVGSAMVGYDGHRGWVYYLAVAPDMRRRHFGQALVERAEQLLIARGCPKFCLMVRRENTAVLDFYRELGFAQDDTVLLGKRLISDL